MKYKRIPGGEKTEKSGIPWSKEELIAVYNLFVKLYGTGIHERNPKIQELANFLHRSTRATEAQLLMYRALSKNLEYSRKNMNKLCVEIWNEYTKPGSLNVKEYSTLINELTMSCINPFLTELLKLQQDGKLAISAPTNWIDAEPLLEVPTEIDNIMDDLQDQILIGEEKNKIGRWHFLIGSPGNGKSAAIGRLCRFLIKEKGCHIFDENGIPITELSQSQVPYALKVYEKDNRFPSALIVQDASVVRNPFSPETDPAVELINTIKDAWTNGRSLVICTNRGVLEKAHIDYYLNKEVNSTPWFKIIPKIVAQNSEEKEFEFSTSKERKVVFDSILIGFNYLDNRSLLIENNIFASIIDKAIDASKWDCCEYCHEKALCPFKTNRDWLSDKCGRDNFLLLLKRAEILSGQVIVFREALSIISLILAGCPIDYSNHSPCEWVKGKIKEVDFLSLGMRRIYMLLFASFFPYGLENVEKLKKRQADYLANLYDLIKNKRTITSNILRHIVLSDPPSTDVGVERILGKNGIISQIDPSKEVLTFDFYNKWDSELNSIQGLISYPYFTDIERQCISFWKDVEGIIEAECDDSVVEGTWVLKRWISNFILHLGIFFEGHTAHEKELDQFAYLLSLLRKDSRDLEEKRKLRQFGDEINALLNFDNSSKDEHDNCAVQLSETVFLTGQWVQTKLKPRIIESQASGSISISLEFEGKEQAIVSASMYLWLCKMSKRNLDPRCFPQNLLTGIRDARIRAASKSQYASENDHVKLIIHTGRSDNRKIEIERFDGDIEIN